jgi:PKD repeat protein
VVKEVGDVAVAVIEGPATICVDDVVTFTAEDSGPGASYKWTFGGSADPAMATTQTVDVVWSSFGVVNIDLEVTRNGCTSFATKPVSVTNSPIICDGNGSIPGQGSSWSDVADEVAVFPNPASSVLTIRLATLPQLPVELAVYTTSGQQLLLTQLQGQTDAVLDLSNFSPGIYFIKVTGGEGLSETFRIVKQ